MDQPRRRHRWITVPSGAVLFVCIFLPALRACQDPIYPITMPPVYPPYVLGLLAAITALAHPSAIRALVLAMRLVVWLVSGAVMLYSLGLMISEGADPWWFLPIVLVAASSISVIAGFGERDELAAARAAMATAVLGILWFGLWFLDNTDDLMIGMYLSAGSSVTLLIGGLEWRREILRDRDPAIAPAKLRT